MGWRGGKADRTGWRGNGACGAGVASILHSFKVCCEREQRRWVVAGCVYMDKGGGGGLVFPFLFSSPPFFLKTGMILRHVCCQMECPSREGVLLRQERR